MSDTITISNPAGYNTSSGTVVLTGAGSGGMGATGAGVNSILSGGGITYSTSTSNWTQPTTAFNDGNTPVMTIPHGENTVQIEPGATLDVKGNVVINGVDLEERLKIIETLLQIPSRDATMEAKHPKLTKLYKEYMKELEKYKTWHRLTGDQDAT
jgi:hypothetical protein